MENTGCHRVQKDRIDRLSLKTSVCTSPERKKLWESCGSQQDKSSLSGGADVSVHLCSPGDACATIRASGISTASQKATS